MTTDFADYKDEEVSFSSFIRGNEDMSETNDELNKQRRRIVVQIPASVAAFAKAAGLSADALKQERRTMGIHVRAGYLIPKDALPAIGRKHGIEVEFRPPPQR